MSVNTLQLALLDAKVVVAVGSGGVGKTTTAAAMAIAAARRGRRCAVLTIDPAKRLAQALGIDAMGNEPRALPGELVSPGAVDAMMLETGNAFDDLITRLVSDDARRERLLNQRLYQVIARQLGGTHEYMAVEKLYALTREDKYDLVILDTPPSVNALDFLDAPGRLSAFFSERITRFFIKRADDQKKGLFKRLRDRAGELALNIMGRALGAGFIEEVQDFSTAFQELFEEFRKRGVVIDELLRSRDTSFVIVTGADPVRVQEAITFGEILRSLDIVPTAFVANRVHRSPGDSKAHLDEDKIAGVVSEKAGAVTRGLERAQQLRSELAMRDRRGLVDLVKHAGKDRLLVVPELDHEVEDRGAVEYVIGALEGEAKENAG